MSLRAFLGLAPSAADLAARIADADSTDYGHCPADGRRTAHAISVDGSRRCWECGHTTAGDS